MLTVSIVVVVIAMNGGRMLANLVTKGLELRAFDIITGSLKKVNFASLVLVAYIIRELCTLVLVA